MLPIYCRLTDNVIRIAGFRYYGYLYFTSYTQKSDHSDAPQILYGIRKTFLLSSWVVWIQYNLLSAIPTNRLNILYPSSA